MLCALAVAASLAAAAPGARAVTVEPPPGWSDATEERAGENLVLALKGPEASSFALTRVPALELQNRSVVRAFLQDVLAALNRKTGLEFAQSTTLLTASYDNGLTFYYIKAQLQGKPRLILGVAEFGGQTVLGTLISSVPDLLMPAILGGLRAPGGVAAAPVSGTVQSVDGQLLFGLPAEVASRALTETEKKSGFVLALQGFGSELMVLKLVDEDAAPSKDQARIVQQTVLDSAGVDAGSLTPVALIDTPPGPDLIYASARVKGGAGGDQFLAGFMPWGYWGYSILAKGGDPAALLNRAFAVLALGPDASPKVVAATPALQLPRTLRLRKRKHLLAAAGGAALVLLLGIWALSPGRVVGAR